MDYWHLEDRAYSAAEVAQFVSQSVQQIRARTSPIQAVAPLGQLFAPDAASTAPSAAEIRAATAAAWAAGAIGVSFYDWDHTTAADLLLLAALPGAQPAHALPAGSDVEIAVPVLNLRAAPSLTAPIIERLAQGTRLAVRGVTGGWVAVVAPDGRFGYVYRASVRTVGVAAPP
jgi:hypothetical protein